MLSLCSHSVPEPFCAHSGSIRFQSISLSETLCSHSVPGTLCALSPLSPVIHHIPSKALSIKTPPPKIFEIPSKAPKPADTTITTNTMNSHDPLPLTPSAPSKSPPQTHSKPTEEVALDLPNLSDIKTPQMLHRHLSEPDAKAMREIERDLQSLKLHDIPETPPFGALAMGIGESVDDLNLFTPGTEQDISAALGMPTDLTYSKTTPLHFDDHHDHHRRSVDPLDRHRGGYRGHSPYGAVNMHYDRPPPPQYGANGGLTGYGPPPYHQPLMGSYPPNMATNDGPPFPMGFVPSKSSPKSKRKKKKKKVATATATSTVPTDGLGGGGGAGMSVDGVGWDGPAGFDFAVHDLNEQLVVLREGTMTVDQEIAATDARIQSVERGLKRTEAEKRGILKALELERMVLRKSLAQGPPTAVPTESGDVGQKVCVFEVAVTCWEI